MLILRSVLLSGFAALAFSAVHAQQPPLTEQQAASGQFVRPDQGEVIKPKAEPHFAAALAAAGETIKGPLLLCNAARPQGLKLAIPSVKVLRAEDVLQGKPPGPARIFDNFYYVGAPNVTAFAVNTPDGIILIDSLNNKGEAQSIIEAGLRKFGLDPARIKYVVVTHGHGDHYGGSAYFAKTYGARILMSDTDWTLAPTTLDKPFFDPAPPRDLVITDGQSLTLGGETLQLYITPGHTLGTVSVLIPVTDHGAPHLAALWGGTGFNFPHSPDRFTLYANSAQRFEKLALEAGADAYFSNHPEIDGTIPKTLKIASRKEGEPNPFVSGKDGVKNFFTVITECALAYGAQVEP